MEKLTISFSGGRSSAVMTRLCLDEYPSKYPGIEIQVVFSNTGCEHPKTLDFVRDCDLYWDFNTTWLEGVVNPEKGVGTSFRVVNYETASRNSEPMEALIDKYGIPHVGKPICSAELKRTCIDKYRKHTGFNKGYIAIGIRADEIDRISIKADERKIIYPLIDKGITKQKVNAIMRSAPFDLELPDSAIYGNCLWCFKKSIRKLLTLAKQDPSIFDFPARMEEKHGKNLYRERMTAAEIIKRSKLPFSEYKEEIQYTIWDEFLDQAESCDQGCEVFNE